VLKLRRPSIIYGGSGALLGFTLLATVLTITTATKTLAPPTPGRGQAATVGQLAQAGGLTLGFGNAAALIGVVMLVLFATSTTAEYGQGTVRTMLIRQPRRARLLVGKLAALLACVAGALLVTEIISMIAAVVLARTRDIPTTQWFTTAGLGNAAGDYANALFAAATFGIFGTALGVLLRSTPLALAIGLAWLLPLENIMSNSWSDTGRWLPGLLSRVIGAGGTTLVSYERAVTLTAIYAAIALTAASVSFVRRDVTT
jgi:ABC-type transport system involved in multi-copper enzyme maturation permease subunit